MFDFTKLQRLMKRTRKAITVDFLEKVKYCEIDEQPKNQLNACINWSKTFK